MATRPLKVAVPAARSIRNASLVTCSPPYTAATCPFAASAAPRLSTVMSSALRVAGLERGGPASAGAGTACAARTPIPHPSPAATTRAAGCARVNRSGAGRRCGAPAPGAISVELDAVAHHHEGAIGELRLFLLERLRDPSSGDIDHGPAPEASPVVVGAGVRAEHAPAVAAGQVPDHPQPPEEVQGAVGGREIDRGDHRPRPAADLLRADVLAAGAEHALEDRAALRRRPVPFPLEDAES